MAAHKVHCPTQPILLQLIDGSGPDTSSEPGDGTAEKLLRANGITTRRFEVVVTDRAPAKGTEESANPPPLDGLFLDGDDTPPGGISGFSPGLGLAVITGLADEVKIEPDDDGTVVRMSWPVLPDPSPDPGAN